MQSLTTKVWGRDFTLKVYFDCCSDEEILQSQRDALEALQKSWQVVDAAKPEVERYCLENNEEDIGSETVDNIFKYVIPEGLYVERNENKRVVLLLCAYRFDPEHGIALQFTNETLTAIDQQDALI